MTWRSRLIALGGVVLAVWLGIEVANDSYVLPFLVGGIAIAAISVRLLGAPLEAIAVGSVLFGYFVGNRGFAQFTVLPTLPLLPAELAILIAGGAILVKGALSRSLPIQRDSLNLAVLLWIVAGTARVVFDVRQYGIMALRDYAMVYYAVFFFFAQHIGREAGPRRFLKRVLIAAAVVLPFAALGSELFPDFFLHVFTFRDVPVIYFKGDLVLTFIAVSALLLSLCVEGRARAWLWVLATAELVFVIGGANRASMLGALSALGWLAISPARRFVKWPAIGLITAAVVVSTMAFLFQHRGAEEKLLAVTERVRSLGDLFGTGKYVSPESSMKGDNNRFRSLWWETAVDEAMSANPVFGLGFGYDLARGFLEQYNPTMEDFTARSPHSIVVTVLARTGIAGTLVLLVFVGAFGRATWCAVRKPEVSNAELGLWASCWVIFVSACFGVVLEGPMGAVVFWSLLGLANSASVHDSPQEISDASATQAEHTLA